MFVQLGLLGGSPPLACFPGLLNTGRQCFWSELFALIDSFCKSIYLVIL